MTENQGKLSDETLNRNLEYLADVAPAVFEDIALCLDRKSIYSMLRVSRTIRSSIQSMMKAKRLEKRIRPFRDTTVVINRNYWALGFNVINFYGFNEYKLPEGKRDIVQMRKPFGKDGLKEMKMTDIIKCLKGFEPRKYVFDMNNNPWVLEKHLNVMDKMEIMLGTTTEILRSAGHDIQTICAVVKPKELILVNPFINQIDEQNYFDHESFQSVEHLRIRGYDITTFQAAQRFNLQPLSEQLISFEFSGNLPEDEYPSDQINLLLKNWADNKNPLKEIKIVAGKVNPLEPILDNALNEINFTSVDRITQLPDLMQEKILKDLVSLDWKDADIFYRLILSPTKRQMGCIYYSPAIEITKVNGLPTDDFSSYFGFYAFDYFPVRKATKRR